MDYKKLMDMTGKVCIVTGGTGYLGTENVKILKDFGATVVVADIRAAEERWANRSRLAICSWSAMCRLRNRSAPASRKSMIPTDISTC